MKRSFPLAQLSVGSGQFSARKRFGFSPFPGRCAGAFTLIELLVVMAVIGVLAAITLAGLSGAQGKAVRDRTRAEVAALSNAIERYKAQNDTYPPPQGGANGYLNFAEISMFMPASPGAVSGGNLNDPYGNPYRYRLPGQVNIATFDVFSDGQDAGNTNDDIGNW
jgi:general secretion pathway protein G